MTKQQPKTLTILPNALPEPDFQPEPVPPIPNWTLTQTPNKKHKPIYLKHHLTVYLAQAHSL